MIRSIIINKYFAKEFIKITINMTLFFFCMGLMMNIFDQINFFKDIDVGIFLPIALSLLFVPSLLYNMFPFIILLSGIWFFYKIKKSDEATAVNVFGVSNFDIIITPSIISIILGIFFITSINPITSILVKKHENIKGGYERDKDYLAALTKNGIWIKEKNLEKNNIIRAAYLENEKLVNITIFELDKNNNFIKRIDAKSADISTLKWSLNNVKIIDNEGKILSRNIDNLSYISMYDIKKIKSLYSNLDTISFWNLEKEIKLLEDRGYSSSEMRSKLQRSLAFPFFLLSMILLSGVFTLGMRLKENNWTYIFVAIITSVLVFYFNDFSAALGKTDKLPVEVSVWMPIVIIFIFGAVGLIHANQK